MTTTEASPSRVESQPQLDPSSREIQRLDQLRDLPIGLDADLRREIASGSSSSTLVETPLID